MKKRVGDSFSWWGFAWLGREEIHAEVMDRKLEHEVKRGEICAQVVVVGSLNTWLLCASPLLLMLFCTTVICCFLYKSD